MSDHKYHEETVSSEQVFAGRLLDIRKLTVKLPSGEETSREVVYHPGAVAILAEPEPGSILCVEQFRKATETTLLEIPAGKMEPGEAPMESAGRELLEETGYHANHLQLLHEFYTSPGFANEKIYLFHATELTQGEGQLDDDEFLDLKLLSQSDVETRLARNEIQDAKTLIALLWWLQQKRSVR